MPPISHRYRPHSAAITTSARYDLSTKQYRIPQTQTYNKLKHNINKTFDINKSAAYTDIIQLTKSSNSIYHNKINQICTKYCIKPTIKNTKHFSSVSVNMIDTDNIAKNFVRRKSEKKQSIQRRNYLNQQIKQQASHVRVSAKKTKTQEFFKLTCENLKKLQRKDKQQKRNPLYFQQSKQTIKQQQNHHNNTNNIKRRLSSTRSNISRKSNRSIVSYHKSKDKSSQTNDFHPYLKIYQQSQKQALQLILNNNTLDFSYDERYPVQINETQEWEKYQKNVKGIYSGIKRMRYAHSAREMAKSGRIRAQSSMQRQRQNEDDSNGFYIT